MNVLAKNKKFWVAGLAAFALVFTGCLTDDEEDADPKITQQPTDQTVAIGATAMFTIAATGTGTLTYKWVIDGDTSSVNNDTISGPVSALLDNADVKCIVTGTKGSVTSNTVKIHITGLTAWPADASVTVGAQAHPTLGTAIDLDVPEAMLSAVANTRQGDIDVLFAYTTGSGTDSVYKILSPVAAKAAGVSVAASYDNSLIVDVRFVPVSAKPANQQAAREIFDDNTDFNEAEVAIGDMFIVSTTDGNYVYLEVTGLTAAGRAGSSTLTVAISNI